MNDKLLPLTDTQKTLVLEHMDLVAQVLNKPIRKDLSNPDMNWDDLYQTGCLALCKAVQYYDAARPFGPYAARAIRNALFEYCEKTMRYHQFICSTDMLPEVPAPDSSFFPLFSSELTEFIKEHGNNSKGVLQKGFFSLIKKSEGYTSKEISKEFGTTTNSVRAWMSLATKKLKEEQELYKRFA